MSLLGIDEKIDNFISNLDSGMPSVCQESLEQIKSTAPWNDRTGTLRSTMKGDCSGGGGNYTMNFDYTQEYGKYIENGAAPHIIEAHGIAMFGEGLSHPISIAHHPGGRAFHHLNNMSDSIALKVADKILECWDSA